MDLKDFCFPVTERSVAVDDFSGNLVDWGNENTYLNNGYKSIVLDDTNKVISLVKDSYRIIRNETLINELLCRIRAVAFVLRLSLATLRLSFRQIVEWCAPIVRAISL